MKNQECNSNRQAFSFDRIQGMKNKMELEEGNSGEVLRNPCFDSDEKKRKKNKLSRKGPPL